MYKKVVLVCDTYKDGSIKGGERSKRGYGKKYIINSPDMKVPYDFADFMKNGENKLMLLNLIETSIRNPFILNLEIILTKQKVSFVNFFI